MKITINDIIDYASIKTKYPEEFNSGSFRIKKSDTIEDFLIEIEVYSVENLNLLETIEIKLNTIYDIKRGIN